MRRASGLAAAIEYPLCIMNSASSNTKFVEGSASVVSTKIIATIRLPDFL